MTEIQKFSRLSVTPNTEKCQIIFTILVISMLSTAFFYPRDALDLYK